MVDEIDIYRSAALPINRYGEDAALEAAAQADDLFDEGDLDRQRVWKVIVKATEDIQRGERKGGKALQ